MSRSQSPPDETQLIVVQEAVRAELTNLEAALQHFPKDRLQDTVLGELRGLDASTYLPVFDAAEALCDQDRFEEALPLTLYLAMHEPRHQPFTFLAASCLQRLGQFSEAGAMYAMGMNNGNNDPIALFRIGECQEALKNPKHAADAFEAALDASRGHPDLWQLQNWAMDRVHALNTTKENQHA